MKIRAVIVVLAGLMLTACGIAVPEDKANYVGEWKGIGMSLTITSDGGVAYERISGGGSTSVKGPLQSFEGDNFSVGLWFFSTMFVVSKPPYEDSGVLKMEVDGVELTRTLPGGTA